MSISFVLLAHLSGTAGFVHLPGAVLEGMSLFGVRVFFVISAFLITSLLLQEDSRTGNGVVEALLPAAHAEDFSALLRLRGAVALVAALGWIELREFDLLSAVTYTTNYHPDRSWYLGHAWSLSVEEQFYLLWPFLMKYPGAAARAVRGADRVMAAPLLRITLLVLAPGDRDGIGETFPTVADAIAAGCLLACYRDRLAASARWLDFLRGRSFWIVPAVAIAAGFIPSAKFNLLVGQTFTNLGIALVIERVVRFPQDLPGRYLNARPVASWGSSAIPSTSGSSHSSNRHASHPWLPSPEPRRDVRGRACVVLPDRASGAAAARVSRWPGGGRRKAQAIPADPPRLGLG